MLVTYKVQGCEKNRMFLEHPLGALFSSNYLLITTRNLLFALIVDATAQSIRLSKQA
ncbi:hypothetical protein ALT716_220005 [Alteromonas macleodii]